MGTLKNITGKIFYGAIFMLLLPLCLCLWARSTENMIGLRIPDVPVLGIILIATGIILSSWAMISLVIYGKGLPMNAYPPKYYVYAGIYAILNHPVYVGSGCIAFGVSLYFKSASGFWMVSPLFCVAMLVFVIGFENEKIKTTTGYFNNKVFFSLPGRNGKVPVVADRLNVFFLALLPWLILYELFIFMGIPKDAVFTNLPFEQQWPVIQWTEIFYILPYILVIIIPFILNTQSQIRDFIQDIWWSMFFVFLIYICFPFAVQQRSFTPNNFLGTLIYVERSLDGGAAALPAFHVVWAFLLSKYYSARFGLKRFWQMLAILISLSCLTNGSHSIPDVTAGYFVYLLVNKRQAVWNGVRQLAENIANSWKEWRWGPVRLINHGLYTGAAGLVGMLVVESCLGKNNALAGLYMALAAVIGAALWAQLVEGSPSLLRPYGYYGGVVGIFVSALMITLFYPVSFLYLLAAFGLAGPWFQVLGRFRCLVQGCCHGKRCAPGLGIRFTHPQSRVLKIASLKGVPIHPTQLYSIGSNLIIGMLLIRLVSLQVPVSMVAGVYLILNGLARFVEEALRGEPQTVYWKGLRIYQWLAIINIIGGALITSISTTQYLSVSFFPGAFVIATVVSIISTIAYGLDFPESNKRFARLTS